MGNIKNGVDDILNIRRTPALNRFLFFLNDCGPQGQIDYPELNEIKTLIPASDKHIYHLILSACLNDKELQRIFSSENTEVMFTNVFSLTDDEEMEKLSKETYVDIVVALGLIEDCICMILAEPSLEIMGALSETLASKLTHADVYESISSDLYESVVASMVKISKVQNQVTENLYRKCVTDLLQTYVTVQLPDVLNSEKFVTLFRLIGAIVLTDEDYQNADEVSVLLEEWEFDKCRRLMNSASMKVCKTLFNPNPDMFSKKPLDKQLLLTLDKCLSLISVDVLGENLNKDISLSSQKFTLSSYLGGCAYLIKMILERQSEFVNLTELPNTLNCIEQFVSLKPKMKHEEVIEDITDFYNFCERMSKFGNRDIYKRDWITKFLVFSVDEIIGTLEGNAIVEAFLIGAEVDLVREFIKKISEADNLSLDDSQKELIIKILTVERVPKQENEDLIKEFFHDGANAKLEMGNFKAELHILSLQLGNIEFEKDVSKLAMHELSVIRLCLQNPVAAITKILGQSIRTEHFRALEFALPLFSLALSRVNEEAPETDMPGVLIANCLYKMLKNYPDYPNSLYDSLSNSMEVLISHGIITEVDIFSVLRFQILRVLKGSARVALSVVVGLVSLLENLVKFASEESLKSEMSRFVINLNRFFCQYTNSKTFLHAVKIKNILGRIIKYLITPNLLPEIIKATKRDIKDLSLFDQGILYVRCDLYRPLIKKILGKHTNDVGFKEFIQTCTLPWVLNCNEDELSSLIDFIFNVVMGSTSKLSRIKNVSQIHLLNETLLLTYVYSVESKYRDAFLHTLRFYSSAVDFIQNQFQEKEWYSLFDTLFTIVVEMSRPLGQKKFKSHHKEIPGLHQVLSYILSKIEEFAKCNIAFSGCDQLMSKLGKIPPLDTKCEPVRFLLSEKLSHLQNLCLA